MQHPTYLAEASIKTNPDSNAHGIARAYWIMVSGKGRNRQSARVHPFYFILQTAFLLSLMKNNGELEMSGDIMNVGDSKIGSNGQGKFLIS